MMPAGSIALLTPPSDDAASSRARRYLLDAPFLRRGMKVGDRLRQAVTTMAQLLSLHQQADAQRGGAEASWATMSPTGQPARCCLFFSLGQYGQF